MIEAVFVFVAISIWAVVAYAIWRSYNPPKCREARLEDFKPGDIVEYVYSNPDLRKAVLRKLESEAKDIIGRSVIISLQQALELPNQLFIFVVLALGGAGVGFFVATLFYFLVIK